MTDKPTTEFYYLLRLNGIANDLEDLARRHELAEIFDPMGSDPDAPISAFREVISTMRETLIEFAGCIGIETTTKNSPCTSSFEGDNHGL